MLLSSGSGKSTMRSRLFYELKKKQYKVEEIVEFAKEKTYTQDFTSLNDQLLVLAKQHHMHKVLDSQVDYIVTDSPFIMGMLYVKDECLYNKELIDLAVAINKDYNTLNFFIERNHEYQEYGRNQNEAEADEKSLEIKKFLDDNGIKYKTLKSGKDFIKKAFSKINSIHTKNIS